MLNMPSNLGGGLGLPLGVGLGSGSMSRSLGMGVSRPTMGSASALSRNDTRSTLTQYRERRAATTSVARAMGSSSVSGPVGSIVRSEAQSQGASSSISRLGRVSTNPIARASDEERDDARYEYMQGQIMRKRIKDREAHKSVVRQNLRGDDNKSSRHYMGDMIKRYQKIHGVITEAEKSKMKHDVKSAVSRGAISGDVKTMNKLIDSIQG